jgi:bifunctional non-homologous end joining protein LigD
MPLAVLGQPFDHRDWVYELKYDGFRALAYVENGRARLVSRKRNTYKTFGVLCDSIAGTLHVTDAILDGEIVHLDADGRPQFLPLLRRRSPQHFVAFDVLWLNGRDLSGKPLIERKRVLRLILKPITATVCAHE